MNEEKLEKILAENRQQKFRLRQILKAIYQDGASSFSESTVLPKDMREKLDRELEIFSFEAVSVLEAGDGQSAKALLKLRDGNLLETVLMAPKPGSWSVCVSSQVGCPMGCRFCATGKMGFRRNLTAEEITDQVLFWKQWLRKFKIPCLPAGRQMSNVKQDSQSKNSNFGIWNLEFGNYDVSNVVYMGMGEPFLNWENVSESLRILTDKNRFGLGSRSISISTSGITEGMKRLAEEFPQINLALSLHFTEDKKRNQFMPVNKKDNLENLKKTLQQYFQKTNRQVFIEYILLKNINDSRQDAEKLAAYLKSIGKLQLLHVNLIRYNTTSENLSPSSGTIAQKFKQTLLASGISATIRKSLASEIKGACGQLAGRNEPIYFYPEKVYCLTVLII